MEFSYDALGRRISSTDYSGSPTTLHYYYDGQNVVAEYEMQAGAEILQRYFIHGAQYIDERAILHDCVNGQDYFYFHRELYTVEGLVDNNGHEVERYTYDAYGRPEITIVQPADVVPDKLVDSIDASFIALNIGQDPRVVGPPADVVENLAIDMGDYLFVRNNYGPSFISSPTSGIGNPYAFTGRRMDIIDGGDLLLYHYRARAYDPHHGRFVQRDPAGYTDGISLYEYVRSRPTSALDPTSEIPEFENVEGARAVYRQALDAGSRGYALGLNAFENRRAFLERYQPDLVDGWGATQVTKQAFANHHILNAIALSFDPRGTAMATTGNRFVYTCKEGWIDIGHYSFSAFVAYASGWLTIPIQRHPRIPLRGEHISVAGGVAVELWQTGVWSWQWLFVPRLDGNATSAFSIEDLPSDLLGARMGQAVLENTMLYNILLTGQKPGAWTVLWNSDPDRVAVRLWKDLDSLGDVDPDHALNDGPWRGSTARKFLEANAKNFLRPNRGPFRNFRFSGKKIVGHNCLCDANTDRPFQPKRSLPQPIGGP